MQVSLFVHPRLPWRQWELNVRVRSVSVRLSPRQVCVWRAYYYPLIGWLAGQGFYGAWQPWNRPGSIATVTPAP